LLTCLALAIALAAAAGANADAATLRLRCAGRGPRNVDSAGTVLCAGSPSRGRSIAGVVRNDAGQPVAARLIVTYSRWIPAGTGYTVRAHATRQLTANADGSFSFSDNPATRESITVDVVADAALGIAYGASAQAQISRKLNVSLAKLGGGTVRLTVKGTRVRPIKAWILSESGYELPGVRPKNVNGRGQATFNLGSQRGRFAYYVDAGVYDDLFWYLGRPPFRL
ncbi:MAG TPA: hypothetical protein VK506_03775, partial [Conexibacter sp.]|nr:hypothetical protein [Conexibacter sp.]